MPRGSIRSCQGLTRGKKKKKLETARRSQFVHGIAHNGTIRIVPAKELFILPNGWLDKRIFNSRVEAKLCANDTRSTKISWHLDSPLDLPERTMSRLQHFCSLMPSARQSRSRRHAKHERENRYTYSGFLAAIFIYQPSVHCASFVARCVFAAIVHRAKRCSVSSINHRLRNRENPFRHTERRKVTQCSLSS